jgi:hypothetical protein
MVILVVVGVLRWLVNSFIPMAGSFRTILTAVLDHCRSFVALEGLEFGSPLSRNDVVSDRSRAKRAA